MRKDGDKYILNTTELGALVNASITTATKTLHSLGYDPSEDALPYIVNSGYKLLYGGRFLYTPEQLNGCLVADEKRGKLIENEGLYKAVADAFGACCIEDHAIYRPDNDWNPGWLTAAVDLFRPGKNFRVYFSHEGSNQIRVEDIMEW